MPAPEGWQATRWRSVPGRTFVCPRCTRTVPAQVEHVVAWPQDPEGRHRHWHAECFASAVREGIERYRHL